MRNIISMKDLPTRTICGININTNVKVFVNILERSERPVNIQCVQRASD